MFLVTEVVLNGCLCSVASQLQSLKNKNPDDTTPSLAISMQEHPSVKAPSPRKLWQTWMCRWQPPTATQVWFVCYITHFLMYVYTGCSWFTVWACCLHAYTGFTAVIQSFQCILWWYRVTGLHQFVVKKMEPTYCIPVNLALSSQSWRPFTPSDTSPRVCTYTAENLLLEMYTFFCYS